MEFQATVPNGVCDYVIDMRIAEPITNHHQIATAFLEDFFKEREVPLQEWLAFDNSSLLMPNHHAIGFIVRFPVARTVEFYIDKID